MVRARVLALIALSPSLAMAEPMSDHVEHKVYSVRAGSATGRVGQPAQFEVSVEIRTGYHLNDDYPIRFTPAATPNVKFPKPLYRDGLKRGVCAEGGHDCRASLPIAFIAQAPGSLQVGGELAFSACSDAQCLIEKINVAAPVEIGR